MTLPTHAGRNLVAFETITAPMRGYLTTVRTVATKGGAATMASLARVELPALVDMVAGLMARHAPDENGRCTTCRTGWTRRRVQAPCAELLCIQGHLRVERHTNRTRILRKVAKALDVTW